MAADNPCFNMSEVATSISTVNLDIDNNTQQDYQQEMGNSAKEFVQQLMSTELDSKKIEAKNTTVSRLKGVIRSHSAYGNRDKVSPKLTQTPNRQLTSLHLANPFVRSASDITSDKVNTASKTNIGANSRLTGHINSIFQRVGSARQSSSLSKLYNKQEDRLLSKEEVENYVLQPTVTMMMTQFEEPSVEDNIFISQDQMQNICATNKDQILIVDCREDSESSRMDMSHWNRCSLADLTEADSLQIERINKTNKFIILATNFMQEETEECHEKLLIQLQLLATHFLDNSNGTLTDIRILKCPMNDVLYLSSNLPIPKVVESFIYLLNANFFECPSKETGYSTVITDNKSVERCFTSNHNNCYVVDSLTIEAMTSVVYLTDQTKNQQSNVLFCCSDIDNIALPLVIAYIMWKYSFSKNDAIKKLHYDMIPSHPSVQNMNILELFSSKLYENLCVDII